MLNVTSTCGQAFLVPAWLLEPYWIFSNFVHLDLLKPMELENHKNLGILLYHPKIPPVSPHPPLSGPFWGLVL